MCTHLIGQYKYPTYLISIKELVIGNHIYKWSFDTPQKIPNSTPSLIKHVIQGVWKFIIREIIEWHRRVLVSFKRSSSGEESVPYAVSQDLHSPALSRCASGGDWMASEAIITILHPFRSLYIPRWRHSTWINSLNRLGFFWHLKWYIRIDNLFRSYQVYRTVGFLSTIWYGWMRVSGVYKTTHFREHLMVPKTQTFIFTRELI